MKNCENELKYNSNKYIPLIDNIKGFLVFSVVFSHSLKTAGCAFSVFPYVIINIFSIPAFVFISGYCCKEDESLTKILKNYLYPYIIWQTIYFIVLKFIYGFSIELNYFIPIHLLWYLFALFFWHLVIWLTKPKCLKSILILIAASLIIALLEGYVESGRDYFNFSKTIVFFPYFVAGYYCRNTNIFRTNKILVKILSHIVIWVIIIITLILLPNIDENWLLHDRPYDVLDYTPGIRLMIIFLGAVMGLAVCFIFPNKRIPILTHLGKSTFSILVLHGLVIFYLRSGVAVKNILASSIIFTFIFALSLTIVFSATPFVKLVKPTAKYPFKNN